MPEAVDDAGAAFTIRELSGDRRTIRLTGRGLPYRPLKFKTVQRMETTWYPGNPEATATILGPGEDPTSINGCWKDKYVQATGPTPPIMVNDQAVADVRSAAVVVVDVARKGQLLEVAWDQQIRRGHLKAFEETWQNVHDLEWAMDFEWISRGEATPPALISAGDGAAGVAVELDEARRQLEEAAASPGFALPAEFSAALDARLTSVAQSVGLARDNSSNFSKAATSPLDAARRTAAVCTALIEQADAVADLAESTPSAELRASADEPTFGQRLAAAVYAKSLASRARAMRRVAAARRSTVLTSVEGDLLGIYSARAGEDLRSVSKRYYGTPNEWRRLLLFNGLRDPELAAGQVVLVPKTMLGGL